MQKLKKKQHTLKVEPLLFMKTWFNA